MLIDGFELLVILKSLLKITRRILILNNYKSITMYVYIYIYIYAYISMYVYIYIHMYLCIRHFYSPEFLLSNNFILKNFTVYSKDLLNIEVHCI